FSSRRRHTRWPRDWSSDVCSSDLRRQSERPDLPLARPESEHYGGAEPAGRDRFYRRAPASPEEYAFLPDKSRGIAPWIRDRFRRSEERRVGKECISRRWARRRGRT